MEKCKLGRQQIAKMLFSMGETIGRPFTILRGISDKKRSRSKRIYCSNSAKLHAFLREKGAIRSVLDARVILFIRERKERKIDWNGCCSVRCGLVPKADQGRELEAKENRVCRKIRGKMQATI